MNLRTHAMQSGRLATEGSDVHVMTGLIVAKNGAWIANTSDSSRRVSKERRHMTTILGQHISLIRPSVPHRAVVYTNERPRPKSPIRSKRTVCAKVRLICVETLGGVIYSLTRGTHLNVIQTFNLDPNRVIRTGWQLENNQFMWR